MEPKIQEKLEQITYLRVNLQNKYGYDKPEELVTESFKNRFNRAYQKFSDSLITDNDALKLSMLDMMTRAYIALQKQLETENIKPTDDNVWRIKHKDGQIIVLCNDKHKKRHYVNKYKDELVMSADEIIDIIPYDIIKFKKKLQVANIVNSLKSLKLYGNEDL
jgi:hypothetical protein